MGTSRYRSGQGNGRKAVGRTLMWAVPLLALIGCSGQAAFLTDVNRVRADLIAQNTALAALVERVHGLEQRLETDARASRRSQQELHQAVEVLLKKALETEDRLANLEAPPMAVKREEKPVPAERAPEARVDSGTEQRLTNISLGMTQEDVRQILGSPISIESAGTYIFWHYSRLPDEQYVVFDQENGRVFGWRGLK